MSKRFRDKPCDYCLTNPSTATGDHVFAREFFPEAARANLPKVPACESCNNEKSRLEHYLTAVLHSVAAMRTHSAIYKSWCPVGWRRMRSCIGNLRMVEASR